MAEEQLRMTVTRYRPGEDREPVTQSFSIPYHDDWVVLDALQYVKDRIDGTLSFRWSCHMGVCGSCGMMVNGTPKLTCAAFLRDYYPAEIVVEPLANFPVVRDLIVDKLAASRKVADCAVRRARGHGARHERQR